MVLCSYDAGVSWIDRTPLQVSVSDYRCAAMPDAKSLVIASAGSPAVILRSEDLGVTWKISYENPRIEAFIDSVSFWDEKRGLAFGDPIDGNFLLLATSDGGVHWNPVLCNVEPRSGEAGFAASNGLISFPDSQSVVIGLGAATAESADAGGSVGSRVLRSDDSGRTWLAFPVDCIPSGPSRGIFSIRIRADGFGIAVGGDYAMPDAIDGNIAITEDGGRTWRLPVGDVPSGFRSSVVYVGERNGNTTTVPETNTSTGSGYWIATGPSGTDISDDGEHWRSFSRTGFHAMALPRSAALKAAGSGDATLTGRQSLALVAAGSEGRVAKISDQ